MVGETSWNDHILTSGSSNTIVNHDDLLNLRVIRQYVYMAKLAEQAERYEEMVKFMEKLVEERNLLSSPSPTRTSSALFERLGV